MGYQLLSSDFGKWGMWDEIAGQPLKYNGGQPNHLSSLPHQFNETGIHCARNCPRRCLLLASATCNVCNTQAAETIARGFFGESLEALSGLPEPAAVIIGGRNRLAAPVSRQATTALSVAAGRCTCDAGDDDAGDDDACDEDEDDDDDRCYHRHTCFVPAQIRVRCVVRTSMVFGAQASHTCACRMHSCTHARTRAFVFFFLALRVAFVHARVCGSILLCLF